MNRLYMSRPGSPEDRVYFTPRYDVQDPSMEERRLAVEAFYREAFGAGYVSTAGPENAVGHLQGCDTDGEA